MPIIAPEVQSDTRTERFAVYQHSPNKPNYFIIEEKDWRYYYGGKEYFRDGGLYFYEASIPDLIVEKGYVIVSHKQGIDCQEISLDDPRLYKKVEIKCTCNCNVNEATKYRCTHKTAIITFLQIKKAFKQCNNFT